MDQFIESAKELPVIIGVIVVVVLMVLLIFGREK